MTLSDVLTAIGVAIGGGSAAAAAIATINHWIRKIYGFERDLAHDRRTLAGYGQALDRLDDQVDALGDRLTRLETRMEDIYRFKGSPSDGDRP